MIMTEGLDQPTPDKDEHDPDDAINILLLGFLGSPQALQASTLVS